MNQEFKRCLESQKIIAFPRGKDLVRKELATAQSDLSDAKAGFNNQLSFLSQGLTQLLPLQRGLLKGQW